MTEDHVAEELETAGVSFRSLNATKDFNLTDEEKITVGLAVVWEIYSATLRMLANEAFVALPSQERAREVKASARHFRQGLRAIALQIHQEGRRVTLGELVSPESERLIWAELISDQGMSS